MYPLINLFSSFALFLDSLHRSVAIHVPYVSIGCLHSIVSGRSGYHQSLQIATNVENEEARRVGNTHLHHIHSNRYIWIRSYFVVYHTYLSLFNSNSAHRRAALATTSILQILNNYLFYFNFYSIFLLLLNLIKILFNFYKNLPPTPTFWIVQNWQDYHNYINKYIF